MAKNDNLKDFLTDVADAIRAKKGTTEKITPQNFSTEIRNIGGDLEYYELDIPVFQNKGINTQALKFIVSTSIKDGILTSGSNGIGNYIEINTKTKVADNDTYLSKDEFLHELVGFTGLEWKDVSTRITAEEYYSLLEG